MGRIAGFQPDVHSQRCVHWSATALLGGTVPPSFLLEYIMSMFLASIGTACIAVALGQLIPEGMWIWLAALAYGCCTLTLAFVWND